MVILVDTSVWVEHVRRTQSHAHLELRELMTEDPGTIATCEPIAMELLAGPTDPFTVRQIEEQLGTLEDLTVDPAEDFRAAAALARAVRRAGHTVRSTTDCLIAAIALRNDVPLWHCDDDYVRIADISQLGQRDLRAP
jgi:predicted nucleic acid-binding protein